MKTMKSQSKSTAPPKPRTEGEERYGLPGTPAGRKARIKMAAKANKETLRRLAE
ncbi:MAG TPA: hypothetical protein VHZ54_10390 [Solirubrobacterales bacterium]|jgi:hypothetical protein|nr:hypothetical protein [Solirubrobacterales bacterium]